MIGGGGELPQMFVRGDQYMMTKMDPIGYNFLEKLGVYLSKNNKKEVNKIENQGQNSYKMFEQFFWTKFRSHYLWN